MTRDDVVARLTTIFRDLFEDDSLELRDAMTAADVEGWDSLQHVNLILEVERQFGIRFRAGEASELKNVGHLIDQVVAKTA